MCHYLLRLLLCPTLPASSSTNTLISYMFDTMIHDIKTHLIYQASFFFSQQKLISSLNFPKFRLIAGREFTRLHHAVLLIFGKIDNSLSQSSYLTDFKYTSESKAGSEILIHFNLHGNSCMYFFYQF